MFSDERIKDKCLLQFKYICKRIIALIIKYACILLNQKNPMYGRTYATTDNSYYILIQHKKDGSCKEFNSCTHILPTST